MKNLSLMTLMIALGTGAVACSDDETSNGGGGSSDDAGAGGSSMGSGGAATGSGGAATGAGGAAMGSGGAAMGSGGAAMGSGGAMPEAGLPDIVDTAVAAGSFTQLAAALGSADLVDALKGEGPFTVFAPTDDAFDAFEAANPGVLAGLTVDQLTEILTYHVVAGAAVESGDLKDGQVVTTLSGSPALIDTTGSVMINDATVTTADIVASNGVIHVIDEIILPPADDIVATAIAAGSFTSLAGALTAANLVSALQADGPFTVFAPTDAAFTALGTAPTGDALRDVLLYHVVNGAVGSGDLVAGSVPTLLTGKSVTVDLTGGVKIDGANVTTANILTKNGVIHVVDAVLVPAP